MVTMGGLIGDDNGDGYDGGGGINEGRDSCSNG